MSNRDDILRSFGFNIEDEKRQIDIPSYTIIELEDKNQFKIKTESLLKISEFIKNMYDNIENINYIEVKETEIIPIKIPSAIDAKFMKFLADYAEYVEQNELPVFINEKIIAASTLEAAIGVKLSKLFVKHFNYKFQRSDLAVKQYMSEFCHMLKCSEYIISNSLIKLFSIAIKVIIQHLPSAEFIIIDE